ncbi:MAG: hypothetical protein IKW28_02590 [Lachnospiraceae bacterium]|nr:hypothetical protein [Lachnospiraceae bacterium]
MSDYKVRGRSFRTPDDYQAALRDERKIQAALKKYETTDVVGKEHIMGVLSRGELKFETLLGEDFLDEMEEKHRNFLNRGQNKTPDKKTVRKRS